MKLLVPILAFWTSWNVSNCFFFSSAFVTCPFFRTVLFKQPSHSFYPLISNNKHTSPCRRKEKQSWNIICIRGETSPSECEESLVGETRAPIVEAPKAAASATVSVDDSSSIAKKRTGGSARFTGIPLPSKASGDEATISNALDYILGVILSDVGSIVLGTIGLVICVANRLIWSSSEDIADVIGPQSRADLLAVFSCIAILVNGVSKLDVTSALAETVVLEGYAEEDIKYTDVGETWLFAGATEGISSQPIFAKAKERFQWALRSILLCTPAKSAVTMIYNNDTSSWIPGMFTGVVPETLLRLQQQATMRQSKMSPSTPILDRFLVTTSKESYLPSLQTLPGKVEFLSYLPQNTQSVLILPIITNAGIMNTAESNNIEKKANDTAAVLVLGSPTAKSFTPRDIAWCQVIASRLDKFRLRPMLF